MVIASVDAKSRHFHSRNMNVAAEVLVELIERDGEELGEALVELSEGRSTQHSLQINVVNLSHLLHHFLILEDYVLLLLFQKELHIHPANALSALAYVVGVRNRYNCLHLALLLGNSCILEQSASSQRSPHSYYVYLVFEFTQNMRYTELQVIIELLVMADGSKERSPVNPSCVNDSHSVA